MKRIVKCRSLRGNVDRNWYVDNSLSASHVVPYVGTWIEIVASFIAIFGCLVVPYVGTWIEIISIL